MKNNDLIINKNPKSRFAEAIKTIRTNLAFMSVDKDTKVILITSCEPTDGKSFITANLATAYAQENKKVLVIDCDLRKGRQHNIFRIPNSINHGYSNLIARYSEKEKDENGEETKISKVKSVDDYIKSTYLPNVDLIPTGPIPPNPTELLASLNNEKIFKALRKKYDIIILDCTPVVGLADATIMTKYSDVNLLVVSSKQTKMELIARAKKAFANVNAEINGVVLNKISTKDIKYGSYYSDKYYGEA